MDNELFGELLTSVQESGKIMRGEMEASSLYEFEELKNNLKSALLKSLTDEKKQ